MKKYKSEKNVRNRKVNQTIIFFPSRGALFENSNDRIFQRTEKLEKVKKKKEPKNRPY